jgi:phosphatidylglycerophosphate synthase
MQRGCIVVAEEPGAFADIAGISVIERLLRTLERCGAGHAVIVSPDTGNIARRVAKQSRARPRMQTSVCRWEELRAMSAKEDNLVAVVRGDVICDQRLLDLFFTRDHPFMLVDSAAGGKFCGAALVPRSFLIERGDRLLDQLLCERLDIQELPAYSPALRRDLRPFCFSAQTIQQQPNVVENALVEATQKGAQDFPAIIHAPIEKFLVTRLCRTCVTPHWLTMAWILIAFVVTVLFATGHLVSGIILAFAIGILDGVDGKLARLRVETSGIGKLEHRFDSLFEVGWPVALACFFYNSGQLPRAAIYLVLLISGQIVDGLAKGVIYDAFAASNSAPDAVDRVVRFFGGRRNVFIWILLACVMTGFPARALVVMAWWQAATALADVPHAIWLRCRR